MRSLIALFSLCTALLAAEGPRPLDTGWRFLRLDQPLPAAETTQARPDLDDRTWEVVKLPHTVRIEAPATANRPFQGQCWYRRRLALPAAWRGLQVGIRFDGLMQQAECFVNGSLRKVHRGGYLPCFLDLTEEARRGGTVTVALRLDNRDNPDIPPGKPLKDLDFCYFGGMYRRAWLQVQDPLHITDPVEADQPGSGGVFVRCETASEDRAQLFVQTHVANARDRAAEVRIRQVLRDDRGRVVARTVDAPAALPAGGEATRTTRLDVLRPRLWHPDRPVLYRLQTEVLAQGRVVDHHEERVGIRHITMDPARGVLLNGHPFRLRGANRHNDFPWIGNAIPDAAQERDARRLKAAGFNFLRLAHYPQSPAFMEACDRLGLMVAVCVPGWQWFRDTPTFREAVQRDIRGMVRRDRNHASLLYWETSLNESYAPKDAFFADLVKLAHQEMPGDQCFTGGDTLGRKDAASIGYDVPYTLWTDFYDRPMAPALAARKGLHREYGDYEFGGEHSTSRMAIGDGESALRLQAWNALWSHNRNLGWGHTLGDALWVGIDHFRGCSEDQPISRCGTLDALRLPKYSYHLFASQRDPDLRRPDVESGPMAFLATEWTPRPGPAKVVVFSNGDEVELFLNGRSLGRRCPDAGPDSGYAVPIPDADPNYWQKGEVTRQDAAKGQRHIPEGVEGLIFDGGNARQVDHPPFTFTGVPFEPGELKAVAYRRGRIVATDRRETPGAPAALRVWIDEAGVPFRGDGSDVVFLRAERIDRKGNRIPANGGVVRFQVQGPGSLPGGPEAVLEGGVASVLLRAAQPGRLHIRAEGEGLHGEAQVRARVPSGE